MIIKERGAGDWFDVDTTLTTPDVPGLTDWPMLTDPTTGLAAGATDDIFFLTGLGDVLQTAGQSIAGSLGPMLQGILGSIFKPAPAAVVVAKPTSSGTPPAAGISTNMLLIGALAVGGYFFLKSR